MKKVAAVKWIDSGLSFAPTWLDQTEIIERAKRWTGEIESVGQVVYEDEDRLLLGICYDNENENWASAFLIHKSAIIERNDID